MLYQLSYSRYCEPLHCWQLLQQRIQEFVSESFQLATASYKRMRSEQTSWCFACATTESCANVNACCLPTTPEEVDPPRTLTWNLRLRRPTPYPLGRRTISPKKRFQRYVVLNGQRTQKTVRIVSTRRSFRINVRDAKWFFRRIPKRAHGTSACWDPGSYSLICVRV